MKKIQLTTLILSFLCIGTMLFAGGFALTGVGSRATSMGGAFRGLADDATAMYWNPAGLGFIDNNLLDLGGTFIMPSGTWDSKGTQYTAVPGFGDKEYEAEKSLRSFPNAFITMAKQPKLKYGLGVYVPYGLGTTWDVYKLPASHTATGPLTYAAGFPENELKSSIAVIDIHPSVAYQIMPNLSAGLGLSVMYTTIELGKISFNPALGATAYLQPISSDMSGNGIGFGANLGLLYKPTECMSIGLSGKLPSTVSMDGEAEIYLWKPQPIVPTAAKVGGKSDITTELNLPADIGLGVSYKVMPNWAVNLDYSYTLWSSMEEVKVKMETPANVLGTTESIIPFKWEDTHRISLGTEYLMGCNSFRAGFFMDQSPIPAETQTPTLSDISTKLSGNLGYGRNLGMFYFDVNAQYIYFGEREIKPTEQTAYNMAGKYNTNSISGNIGIGYRF
jgi:long-chain fatty acid transport protein